MVFNTFEEAEIYKRNNGAYIDSALDYARSIEGVAYGEVWLNEHTPSFVAGFSDKDEIIVSIPLV